ncbi:MAG: FHA domain-containing protein [Myxococcales bacterium]|nr:FHA domain-containing protein [Myxococcales bacterium]
MVDGFGGAHAIGPVVGIGRSHDRELIVLASSVSRGHAEIRRTGEAWTVRDLGSRNGTFVNGVRTEGAVALPPGALLKVGDVGLWFIANVEQEPSLHPTETIEGSQGRRVRYQLDRGDLELSVVTSDDDPGPGALLWRPHGAEAWSERNLTVLEFQLLRALCRSARGDSGSPSRIRGCVPSKQLVSDLPFQSKYANQENVRQVVLRLRGVLAEVGVDGLLAVAPGRGYYLACKVKVMNIE